MSEYLRDRINRKLNTLSDERLYQVLDFVEFLEARYAEKPAVQANVFQRFADGVEDKLRAGGVAATTVAETMGLLGKAMGVLNGVAQSTMSVASDVVTKAKSVADGVTGSAIDPSSPVPGTQTAPPASTPGTSPGNSTPPGSSA